MSNNTDRKNVIDEEHPFQEMMLKHIDHIPDEDEVIDLAELFKVFGDSSRIRILFALYSKKELCVFDIAVLLNMTQSAVSHQLKILKQAKLVSSRREGKLIYYSLADAHVNIIISHGLEHIEE